MDARRSNCWFGPAPETDLATGSSLGAMRCDPNLPLHVCQVDIANAFYNLEMPIEWRRFFGLPRVRAADVGVSEINGCPVSPQTWIFPCVSVVPMGWSHATAWCQAVLRKAASDTGHCSNDTFISDSQPMAPDIAEGPQWTAYIDNFLCFGHDGAAVERITRAVDRCLRERGLPTHEQSRSATSVDALGWRIDGVSHRMYPTPRRAC